MSLLLKDDCGSYRFPLYIIFMGFLRTGLIKSEGVLSYWWGLQLLAFLKARVAIRNMESIKWRCRSVRSKSALFNGRELFKIAGINHGNKNENLISMNFSPEL